MKIRYCVKGFSLVEMIVYIAILTTAVSAMTLTATSMLTVFTHLRASQDIAEAGMVAMERITREVRFAESVTIGASTLGTSPGTLTLQTVDAAGDPATVTFSLSGGRIMISDAGIVSALTRNNVTVSSLIFTHILGSNSAAVLVTCTIQKDVRGTTVTKDFRTFVVLKG